MRPIIRRQLQNFRNPRANLVDLLMNQPRHAVTLAQRRSVPQINRQIWTLSTKQTCRHHQVRLRSYSTESSALGRFRHNLAERAMILLARTFDHKESQNALGKAHLTGIFGKTPRSKTQAEEQADLSKAQDQNENDDTLVIKQQLVGLHSGEYEQDIPEAMKWFYMAASNHNDPDSQFFLGMCLHFSKVLGCEIPVKEYQLYRQKDGEEPDVDIVHDLDTLAFQWFQRAADDGNHADAQYQLGMWYISNAPEDDGERHKAMGKALRYLNLAKKQGHQAAIETLNDINS